jgi:hypothetical protein
MGFLRRYWGALLLVAGVMCFVAAAAGVLAGCDWPVWAMRAGGALLIAPPLALVMRESLRSWRRPRHR